MATNQMRQRKEQQKKQAQEAESEVNLPQSKGRRKVHSTSSTVVRKTPQVQTVDVTVYVENRWSYK